MSIAYDLAANTKQAASVFHSYNHHVQYQFNSHALFSNIVYKRDCRCRHVLRGFMLNVFKVFLTYNFYKRIVIYRTSLLTHTLLKSSFVSRKLLFYL